MKVVLDTNVIVSAFVTSGLCGSLMIKCLAEHEIVLSEHICLELRRHLVRKARHAPSDAEQIIGFLREQSLFVEPVKVAADVLKDPDDLPVLGTALAAEADALVTGDKQLLELGEYQGIPILSPRDFYDRLPEGS